MRLEGIWEEAVDLRLAADGRARKKHLLLFLLNPRFFPNEVYPLLTVLRVASLQVEILGWREETEDIPALLLGVFQKSDSRQVCQVYLVPQLVLLLGLVYGQGIRSEY